MGPFLGRKRQTSQLRSRPEIHAELEAWHATIPSSLKYRADGQPDPNQPTLTQMQAIALHLGYDNLQIVLHRQAVFPKTSAAATPANRSLSLQQLFQSATRTARAPKFPATDRICRSSHAAMHVGMCSFSAGVVLCALLAMPDNVLWAREKLDAVASLDAIIALLGDFPGRNYQFAQQSVQILRALRAKVPLKLSGDAGSQTYALAAGAGEQGEPISWTLVATDCAGRLMSL